MFLAIAAAAPRNGVRFSSGGAGLTGAAFAACAGAGFPVAGRLLAVGGTVGGGGAGGVTAGAAWRTRPMIGGGDAVASGVTWPLTGRVGCGAVVVVAGLAVADVLPLPADSVAVGVSVACCVGL